MNKIEYILTCIIEECSEVQKAATKAQRFGLHDKWKEEDTPFQQLCNEYNDLLGTIKLLQDELGVKSIENSIEIQSKIDKIKYYMEYSKTRNTLV